MEATVARKRRRSSRLCYLHLRDGRDSANIRADKAHKTESWLGLSLLQDDQQLRDLLEEFTAGIRMKASCLVYLVEDVAAGRQRVISVRICAAAMISKSTSSSTSTSSSSSSSSSSIFKKQ